MSTRPPSRLVELAEVMTRLRAECPWKAGQSHRSLVRYLLEETHEVVEAIEQGTSDDLREELGDLLLQVYFHAAIAAEDGEYDVEDVAGDLIAKLVRRNPHVFGPESQAGRAATPEEVNEAWEQIKRSEKQRTHPTDGLPASLPALLYADKVVDRVQRAGHPVRPEGDELGDRLLALVLEAHAAGLDPEQELREAVRRIVPPA